MVRRLDFPNHGDKEPEVSKPRVHSLSFPTVEPVKAPEAPVKRPVAHLNPTAVATPVRPPSKNDEILEAIKKINPKIEPIRVRARISTLLVATTEIILNWGGSNLELVATASAVQAKIASRMAQINATGWIKDTMAESCRKPSFMDLMAARRSPAYYEGMLKKSRAELMHLVTDVDTIATNFEPHISEIELDAVAISVVSGMITDPSDQIVMNNRARSLMTAHQTGIMLLQTIKNLKAQVAQLIQQIDDLLSITIPNWKMANSK